MSPGLGSSPLAAPWLWRLLGSSLALAAPPWQLLGGGSSLAPSGTPWRWLLLGAEWNSLASNQTPWRKVELLGGELSFSASPRQSCFLVVWQVELLGRESSSSASPRQSCLLVVWEVVRVGGVWVYERSMTLISPGPNIPGLVCQTQWVSRPAPGVLPAPFLVSAWSTPC